MIAGITGILESCQDKTAVVRVGGLSLEVHIPGYDSDTLGKIGNQVHLYTYLYLRTDLVTLYGFARVEELQLFKLLLDVHGIGPKTAMSMLSAMEPAKLVAAITGEDINTLMQIPGIGKKAAGRIVLELKSKLEKIGIGLYPAPAVSPESEVVAVLTGLGFTANEALRAAASLPAGEDIALEEKIKLALSYFANR